MLFLRATLGQPESVGQTPSYSPIFFVKLCIYYRTILCYVLEITQFHFITIQLCLQVPCLLIMLLNLNYVCFWTVKFLV